MRRRSLISSLLIGLMASVFVPESGASPLITFQSTAVLQGRVAIRTGPLYLARKYQYKITRPDSHETERLTAKVIIKLWRCLSATIV
jgi:hypothetical protein